MPNPLYRQHIISISDLSREQLECLLQTALKLKRIRAAICWKANLSVRASLNRPRARGCRLKRRCSGWAARSSAFRTARIPVPKRRDACRYRPHHFRLHRRNHQRHPKDGAARVAAEFSRVPVINASDGTNQHPSQTLLDPVTIYETQGRLDKLKIAMAGDLKYGRTVHSLCQALKRWGGEFAFVSPPSLAMPDYITEELDEANCRYRILGSLEEAAEWADILYMTRVQRERFDEQEFAKIQGKFNLDASMLARAKPNLRVLHPLPRVDEIHPDVDATPHAYYFEQATNGVYARMAILSLVLNEEV